MAQASYLTETATGWIFAQDVCLPDLGDGKFRAFAAFSLVY